jgi:DNA repair protein RadC
VAKEALAANAANVLLAHNHPSGSPDRSEANLRLTHMLALALVDIRVLDHFVVAGPQVFVCRARAAVALAGADGTAAE